MESFMYNMPHHPPLPHPLLLMPMLAISSLVVEVSIIHFFFALKLLLEVIVLTLECRGFISLFSRRVTGFHRRAKCFELNFFIRETFH